jgi:transglutaminase-like putative cysteine protease
MSAHGKLRALGAALCVCVLAAPASLAQEAAKQAPSTYYRIVSDGKLVGWASVTGPVEIPENGAESRTTQGAVRIRTTAIGQKIEISIDTELVLARDDTLISYKWNMQRGQVKAALECRRRGDKLDITRTTGNDAPKTETIDWADDIAVLGDNDIGGVCDLARRLAPKMGQDRVIRIVTLGEITTAPLKGLGTVRRTVLGRERDAYRISMGEGVSLVVDPETRELWAIEDAQGNPIVALTTASVVDEAAASQGVDVLASHFILSDVAFLRPDKVSRLEVEVEARVPVTGEASQVKMTGRSQKFEGTVNGDAVAGRVTVESPEYTGEGSLPLPVPGGLPDDVKPFTEPSPLIESADEAIVAKAKEVCADAKTAWEAVDRAAKWVSENIAGVSVADSPSAKLALETRKGDCGPHATLTIAMLRAVGVPAKLVVGLLYNPYYGGTFGQHGWVEAYVGEPGWIPVDPTTGETSTLCAVHLKFAEGLGSVIPSKLHIVSHEGGDSAPIGEPVPGKMAWKLDTPYVWTYAKDGKDLGTETVTFRKGEGDVAYVGESRLSMDADGKKMDVVRTVDVDSNLVPLKWHSESVVDGKTQKVTLTLKPDGGEMTVEEEGNAPETMGVAVPTGCLVLGDNAMISMMLALPRLGLEPGKSALYRFLHLGSRMTIGLAMTLSEAVEERTVAGAAEQCRVLAIPTLGAKMWVTLDGRIVADEQGPVSVTLK